MPRGKNGEYRLYKRGYNMKYAIVKYIRKGVVNIGDDIQLLAIKNIFKHMGIASEDLLEIDFYNLTTYDGEDVILPICFPFYGYNVNICVTCFSPKIHPVFLSLSLMDTNLCQEDIAYMKKFEPIGCRDNHTADVLKKHGIKAYLNGCITASLPSYAGKKHDSKIYCVDVYDKLSEFMPEEIGRKCIRRSHIFYNLNNEDTGRYAEKLLDEYEKKVSLVITSRLHCAVPCMAMGIPAILIHPKFNYRFTWLEDLIPVYTPDMYGVINWYPSPINIKRLKELMTQIAVVRLSDYSYSNKEIDEKIDELEGIYARRAQREYVIDCLEVFKEYLNKNWSKDAKYRYALWGIIQHSSVLVKYITENYPGAVLTAVIDSYKNVDFLGMKTQKIEEVDSIDDLYVFVAASAAVKYADNYFRSIGMNMEKVCYWTTPGIL